MRNTERDELSKMLSSIDDIGYPVFNAVKVRLSRGRPAMKEYCLDSGCKGTTGNMGWWVGMTKHLTYIVVRVVAEGFWEVSFTFHFDEIFAEREKRSCWLDRSLNPQLVRMHKCREMHRHLFSCQKFDCCSVPINDNNCNNYFN